MTAITDWIDNEDKLVPNMTLDGFYNIDVDAQGK